jgi:hypothetical protein
VQQIGVKFPTNAEFLAQFRNLPQDALRFSYSISAPAAASAEME